MSQSGPLAGITVIDLTRVLAGPYCTMVLLDLGAEVIKVETPAGGDDSRSIGPFVKERSAYFMSLNRGKQSIALDLKAPEDRAIFEKLLARADVLVENYRAGTMEKLGYGWGELESRYPRLIYAATSGFGHTGPYASRPAYDMVVQGMGGIMSLTGHPGGPPTRVGSSVGDITAGLFTTIGINAALYHRNKTGRGIKIDVSMLDCQVAILENAIARYFATGEVPGPIGARHPSISPFEAYQTADGHVIIAAGNDKLFAQLAEAIGAPALASDARFVTGPLRNENVEALKQAIEAALTAQPTAHWLRVLETAGVPCGPINNVAQILSDPQIAVRNMVVSAIDPVAGELKMAGNPIKLSAFEDPASRGQPPELDADRERILQMIAESDDSPLRIERLTRAERDWVGALITERNGSTIFFSNGKRHDVRDCPGFVARKGDKAVGLLTYDIEGDSCELVSLDSLVDDKGVGSALVEALCAFAQSEGCRKIWVITTNDNLRALGFYQKRGFRMSAINCGGMDENRERKPGVPLIGKNDIPLHDEFVLERVL